MDIHPEKLARLFYKLEPKPKLTERYISDMNERHRVYRTERQHMAHWFETQATLGAGAYSRRRANGSSRAAYNRLQTTPGLLWIAEAMGADPLAIMAAIDDCKAEPSKRRRYKIVRDWIPWDLIAVRIPEVRNELFNSGGK